MRAVVLVSSLLAACAAPPQSDVFLPPYAEKGCWARFYEKPDFGLPMRQLEGPSSVEAIPRSAAAVPDMEDAGVQPLFSEVRSLIVGPHAKLIGYSGTLFRGEATVIDRATSARDAASVGYPRFASLRMLCEA
jgi:hypothetical protein